MGARGRQSNVAKLVAGLDAARRPDPPGSLCPIAAAEWRLVVSGLPAEWFGPENLTVLEHRCMHVAWMYHTAEAAKTALKNGDHKAYNMLSRQLAGQARLLLTYDTSMRLTQQASYDKSKRKGARSFAKATPWQDAAGD